DQVVLLVLFWVRRAMSVAPWRSVCCAGTNLRSRLRREFPVSTLTSYQPSIAGIAGRALVRGGPSEGGTAPWAESPLRGPGCCLSRRGRRARYVACQIRDDQ